MDQAERVLREGIIWPAGTGSGTSDMAQIDTSGVELGDLIFADATGILSASAEVA